MKIIRVLVLSFILFSWGMVNAQSITGSVSDAQGPLPGVNVIVKGTANGIQTDFDGIYKLEDVGSNDILVFSYLGHRTAEVEVGNKTSIDIVLEEDVSYLDEVVVIGYGTTTKDDATGAVDAIRADDIKTVNAANPAEALRGRIAGVQIGQTNGEPGAGINIRVRGNSSIRSGNEPLIVVDGIPLSGGGVSSGGSGIGGLGSTSAKSPLNFINQADIESMTVLKDASSTAIYGSRGANGVILITTKGGKKGEAQLEYSSNVTVATLRNDLGLMTPEQYGERVIALGLSEDFGGRTYNWKDAILRTGISTSHNLGITFGGEASSNRVSLGLQEIDGIVKNTDLKRYTGTFDNKSSFFDNALEIGTKLSITQIEDRSENTTTGSGAEGNLMASAFYWNPTRNSYNPDGSDAFVSETYLNPVSLLDAYDDRTATTRILASVSPKIRITDNFSFTSIIGVDYSFSERASTLNPNFRFLGFSPASRTNSNGDPVGGFAGVSTVINFNRIFENYFTYKADISDDVFLNALLGYSYYDYNGKGRSLTARDFNPNQTNLIDNLEGGISNLTRVSSYRSRNELQSFYGRIESTLFKNLLVTGSIRLDGSTRPGADEKYGAFPAIGMAYKIVNNAQSKAINDLKLRINYGLTGNQEFSNNSSMSTGQYNDTNLSQSNNANNQLRWETTTSYGAGLDYALFDYKVTGSIDVFLKETEDLIFPTEAAASFPGTSLRKFVNLDGILENKGIEFSIDYKAVDSKDITFSVGANASYTENVLKDFTSTAYTGLLYGPGLGGVPIQSVTNNEALGTYFLKEWVGLDENGFSQFRREDGSITDLSDAPDLLLSGKTGIPKLNIGFNSNFRYKNLDFSTSWYGQYGHYIYNNTANALFSVGSFNGGKNVPLSLLQSGQSESDVASPSTLYLEKGDFLRLANIELGYTFNTDSFRKIKSLRMFVNGANLITFTDYSGFDPEVSTPASSGGIPGAGIDYIVYPVSKSFTLGLNIKF